MPFSEVLKDLRTSRALTRQQLADATGLSVHTIVSYERGRREPNAKALVALERFFQVSGDYLRGNIEKAKFIENSESVQNDLALLRTQYERFQMEFSCSSQQKQMLSISVLSIAFDAVANELLHNNACPSLTPEEVKTIFTALVQLTPDKRKELTKRAEELLLLQQYQI